MDILKYNIPEIINNVKTCKFFTNLSKMISCLKAINDDNLEENTSKTALPRFKRYYRNNKKHEVNDLEYFIMIVFAAILVLFLIYIFIVLISSCCKKRSRRVDIDNSDYDSEESVYVHSQMAEPYRSSPYAYFAIPPPPNYPPPPSVYYPAQVQRMSSTRRSSYPQYVYLVPCQPQQQSPAPSSPIRTAGNVIPSPDNNESNPPQTTTEGVTPQTTMVGVTNN